MERYFEMFTPMGEKACNDAVDRIIEKLSNLSIKDHPRKTALTLLGDEISQISKEHDEVGDSEPPANMCDYINEHFKKLGIDLDLHRYDIIYPNADPDPDGWSYDKRNIDPNLTK